MVNGKAFGRNPSSKQAQDWLITGQQQELIIQFRHDGMAVFLDDNPVTTLATNYDNMSLGQMFQLPHGDTLGISVDHDDLTIESVEVLEISGPGKSLR
jgi:hypothetical protein